MVRDRRAILADRIGQRFLRHRAFVEQPPVGGRLVDRIEVLPLDVLDQRDLQQLVVADLAHDHGRPQEAGNLRGAPPALAGDDLEAVAAAPHEDRLDDAVHADRLRELLERPLLNLQARLPRVGHDAVEIDLERYAARRGRDADGAATGASAGASGIRALRPRPSAGRFSATQTSLQQRDRTTSSAGVSRSRFAAKDLAGKAHVGLGALRLDVVEEHRAIRD